MFQSMRAAFTFGLFSLTLAVVAAASPRVSARADSSGNGHGVLASATRSLCSEIQALRNLIPPQVLDEITAMHYKHDGEFRHAMRFLNTPEFAAVAAQIEGSPAYEEMLMLFEDAGVDTTDIASIAGVLDCFLIPTEGGIGDDRRRGTVKRVQQPKDQMKVKVNAVGKNKRNHKERNTGHKVKNNQERNPKEKESASGIELQSFEAYNNVESHESVVNSDEDENENDDSHDPWEDDSSESSEVSVRSMSSYANDIMRAIPRKKFRQVLNENLTKNPQFAQFYSVAQSPAFRRQILRSLSSKELAGQLAILKENFIDLRRLALLAMKIFSWGPRRF